MIEPPPLDPLTEGECFLDIDATLTDFWRFALLGVTTNNVRGWLAEYLVWQPIGVERPAHIETGRGGALSSDGGLGRQNRALAVRRPRFP